MRKKMFIYKKIDDKKSDVLHSKWGKIGSVTKASRSQWIARSSDEKCIKFHRTRNAASEWLLETEEIEAKAIRDPLADIVIEGLQVFPPPTCVQHVLLKIRRGTWDEGIAQEVILGDTYRTRGWQPKRNPSTPKYIVDVGAHIGSFSAWMGMRYPDAVILAFEVSKENYALLLENTKAYPRVVPCRGAVYGETKGLLFAPPSSLPANTGGGRVVEDGLGDIPLHTLESIFASMPEMDRLDLLKLDCEGSEFPILRDAPTHILERIDYLTMEIHLSDDPSLGDLKEMEDILKTKAAFPHVDIVATDSVFLKKAHAWR